MRGVGVLLCVSEAPGRRPVVPWKSGASHRPAGLSGLEKIQEQFRANLWLVQPDEMPGVRYDFTSAVGDQVCHLMGNRRRPFHVFASIDEKRRRLEILQFGTQGIREAIAVATLTRNIFQHLFHASLAPGSALAAKSASTISAGTRSGLAMTTRYNPRVASTEGWPLEGLRGCGGGPLPAGPPSITSFVTRSGAAKANRSAQYPPIEFPAIAALERCS